MRHQLGFQFGMVFPADELLSEWVATLALAFNDLSLVHVRIDEDQNTPHKFFYWLRLGVAHYFEAGTYLSNTSELGEVREFVGSLEGKGQSLYEECLASFHAQQTALNRVRSQAAFHYPRLQPGRTNRPMKAVLEELLPGVGLVDKGETGRVRDSRLLFADDIASAFFVKASGGMDRLEEVHTTIQSGIESFMQFTNVALDEWFARAEAERGAKWFSIPVSES
jgi:hypothetical protein